MAYIHTTGGLVIPVPASREAVAHTLNKASDRFVEFETAEHGTSNPVKVSLHANQVVAVTEEPLPTRR